MTTIDWKIGFNYLYEFTIPQSNKTQIAVISFPKGITIDLGWNVTAYKLVANGERTELTVPAWQIGGAVYVGYTGTETFNPQVIDIKYVK